MYRGRFTQRAVKHRRKHAQPRRMVRRSTVFGALGVVFALLLGITGGTLAFLSASAGAVTNEFTYARVSTSVSETFDGNTKEHVCVANQGNVYAYIRARVVVSWQDAQGNVYPFAPDSGDYSIEYGSDWTLRDGYWYYHGAVSPNGQTTELIQSCSASDVRTVTENGAKHTYYLCVEILAEGIQAQGAVNTDGMGALGTSAMEHAWGIPSGEEGTAG